MRPSSVFSTPLIIATMAFAVVAFLFLIDTSINSDATRKNANTTVTNQNTNTVACTLEAKLCPDGSAVGRTGPNCEFAECPRNENRNATNSTKNTNTTVSINEWTMYENGYAGYSLRYPPEMSGGTTGPRVPSGAAFYTSDDQEFFNIAPQYSSVNLDEYSDFKKDVTNVTIGGKQAEKVIWTDAAGERKACWYRFLSPPAQHWDADSSYIHFSCSETSTIQRMVATFEFLPVDRVWKKFISLDHNYSFEHPFDLKHAEIQGGKTLGTLDTQVAQEWSGNLLLVDGETGTDEGINIAYIYVVNTAADLEQYLSSNRAIDESLFRKAYEVVNGIIRFEQYYSIAQPPYNQLDSIYYVSHNNKYYIFSIMDEKLGQQLLSTFTFTTSS